MENFNCKRRSRHPIPRKVCEENKKKNDCWPKLFLMDRSTIKGCITGTAEPISMNFGLLILHSSKVSGL